MTRVARERSFHDHRYGGAVDSREKMDKYYSINRVVFDRFNQIIRENCRDKNMLEYGCGAGNDTKLLRSYGARLTGIDISHEGIRKARSAVPDAQFVVMDAENMSFSDNAFEVVVGSGILHHLNLARSLAEINRVLSSGGRAVFVEPLGHNPLINLYRRLTPKMRTPDEHPLRVNDIDLLSNFFEQVNVEYFNIISILAVPFRETWMYPAFLRMCQYLDGLIFRIPYFRRFAWIVILDLQNPRKH